MINNKDLVVLDVREREAYLSGHISGAVNIPVDSTFSPNPPRLIKNYPVTSGRGEARSQAICSGYTAATTCYPLTHPASYRRRQQDNTRCAHNG
ncbi:MAG TPA: hypothetical protein ENI64_05580 [Gammaproteobacteria bacterium]|nr:hypothetical protein [Gammaproteobacteria bacterium]